ncbi:hypothetical protein LshimejAT787_0112560 [Lyophyllum shimeji]|uniref:Uncharacterized protein n=1 Tax=Lyophyllum shimeji TaxID=47721 RepID=A0A9P3PEC7_LYOSH|nr:hypothetical protein LshimejAT787_0112560 [Lyophyllum shimeji]
MAARATRSAAFRSTRSNTKTVEDIPLPPRRKAPQRGKTKKTLEPEEEVEPEEEGDPAARTPSKTKRQSKRRLEAGDAEAENEPEEEPESEWFQLNVSITTNDSTSRRAAGSRPLVLRRVHEPEEEHQPEEDSAEEEEPPIVKPSKKQAATDVSGEEDEADQELNVSESADGVDTAGATSNDAAQRHADANIEDPRRDLVSKVAGGRPNPTPRVAGSAPANPDDTFVSSRMGFRRSPVPQAPPVPPPRTSHIPRPPSTACDDGDDETSVPRPRASRFPGNPPPTNNTPDSQALASPPRHPTPIDSEPSGSDFEETELEKERQLARVPEHRRAMNQEEQDAEDEEAMEQELQLMRERRRSSGGRADGDDSSGGLSSGLENTRRKKKRRSKPKGKGKGRAVEEDHEGHDEDGHSFKPGPIPDVAKDAAFTAHAEYQRRMAEIAGQYQKPVLSLYQLVGQSVPTPRHEVNRWNAFQAWYGVHGSKKKEKGTKASERARVLADEYEKYLKDDLGEDWEDPDREAECMEPVVEWFKDRTADYAPNMKADGKFGKVMASVAEKFIQSSAQAYELYGVHVFGFIINTDVDEYGIPNSMAWGGTQAYEQLRSQHKATIATQLADYQAMFRVEEMRLKGLEVAGELFAVSRKLNPGEKDRDGDRRIFSMYLRSDLGKILHARGTHTLEACKQIKVPWVGWADFAYKEKIRIINWPPSARAPSSGFDLHSKNDGIPHRHMKASNTARLDPDDESAIMIVEWSLEQKALRIDDPELADVPLVLNTNGRAVLLVSDSTKYQTSIAGQSKSKKKPGLLRRPPEDVRPRPMSLAVLIYGVINLACALPLLPILLDVDTLTPTLALARGGSVLTLAHGEIVPAHIHGEIIPTPSHGDIVRAPFQGETAPPHGVTAQVPALSPTHAGTVPTPTLSLTHAGTVPAPAPSLIHAGTVPAPAPLQLGVTFLGEGKTIETLRNTGVVIEIVLMTGPPRNGSFIMTGVLSAPRSLFLHARIIRRMLPQVHLAFRHPMSIRSQRGGE